MTVDEAMETVLALLLGDLVPPHRVSMAFLRLKVEEQDREGTDGPL